MKREASLEGLGPTGCRGPEADVEVEVNVDVAVSLRELSLVCA